MSMSWLINYFLIVINHNDLRDHLIQFTITKDKIIQLNYKKVPAITKKKKGMTLVGLAPLCYHYDSTVIMWKIKTWDKLAAKLWSHECIE